MVVDFRVAFVFFRAGRIVGVLRIGCRFSYCFGAYGCNLLRSLTWKTFFVKVNKNFDRTFDEVQIIFSQWISKLEVKLDNFYQTWCIQILRTSVWKIQLKHTFVYMMAKNIKYTDFSEKSCTSSKYSNSVKFHCFRVGVVVF